MNKAIKYRIYPTTEQKELFSKTFGCCRKVYNLMLSDKIKHYQDTGKSLMTTPAMYKKDYPFLKEVDSLALANEQLNLQSAYKNFFRDKKVGFPKFKSAKRSRKSYTTNNQNGTVSIFEKTIRLPKVGYVNAKIHRLPKEDWKLKSATISLDSDGKYYISILFEYDIDIKPFSYTDNMNVLGLDYKSDGLYMDNNGNIGSRHKFYRKAQKKLAKEQRKLSRKIGSIKGEPKSNNYLKQLKKVNKVHRHIANQRLDYLHKQSTKIANLYDVVCVEDINMKSLSNKGFGNGKATLDNGYGLFVNMLSYKLHDRGKMLVKVDRFYPSSQICSCCGKKHKESISDPARLYTCECGLVIDRDLNAAINIRSEGIRILKEGA